MTQPQLLASADRASATRKATAKGAGWMVLMRLFDRGLGVISMIILARLLTPLDYGLIAMAAGFTEFLYLLTAFGFDAALIQRINATRIHFNTAWTFNVIFGLTIGLLMTLCAPSVAAYFAEARLENVMYVMAFGPVMSGFNNIGTVLFRKELNFQREAFFMASKRMAGFVVTLVIAFWIRSYWALVAGMIATAFAGLALSYIMHPYRPAFSLSARRDLFGFSAWLFLNNVIRFTNSRALEFVIAKMAGPQSLGLFSVANDISSMPTSELSSPINRALLPGYAKLQHDDAQLRRTVLDVFSVLGLLAVPAGVGIAVIAELLVPVMLGARWLETIPLIQILAIGGAIGVMQNNSYLVYLVKGRPRITTWIAASFAVLQGALVIILLPGNGVIGAAFGMLIARIVFLPIEIGMLMHILKISPRALAAVLWRPIFASIVMWVAVSALIERFNGFDGPISVIALLGIVLLGAAVFAAVVFVSWLISGRQEAGERLLLKFLPGQSYLQRFSGLKKLGN